jgi:hypothetical protein
MAKRPLAQITDYSQLIAALRKRRDELDVSGEWLDEIAGFPDRYAQKLLRGGSRPEEKVRRLSMKTLGPILGALGVRLVLIVDHEAMRRIKGRLVKRTTNQVRHRDDQEGAAA